MCSRGHTPLTLNEKPSNTHQHLGFVFSVYVYNQLIFPASIESAVVTGVLPQL